MTPPFTDIVDCRFRVKESELKSVGIRVNPWFKEVKFNFYNLQFDFCNIYGIIILYVISYFEENATKKPFFDFFAFMSIIVRSRGFSKTPAKLTGGQAANFVRREPRGFTTLKGLLLRLYS